MYHSGNALGYGSNAQKQCRFEPNQAPKLRQRCRSEISLSAVSKGKTNAHNAVLAILQCLCPKQSLIVGLVSAFGPTINPGPEIRTL